MSKYDVIALGELLIDFTNNGTSSQGNPIFEANPGGAPCNVLAMLNKLGKKVSFIGKVGNDQFGRQLRATLEEVGINSDNLLIDAKVPTTLAFVHTFPDGDREFSFYRKPGADMMLCEDDIREDMVDSSKIFHFGTLSMTSESSHKATIKAIELAKNSGAIISLDPNLRVPLWDDLEEAKQKMWEAISYCDILKISDNEVQFLTDIEDYDEGIALIKERCNTPLICLTLGKDGSRAYYKNMRIEAKGFEQKNVVDTTGAGDTFCGAVLSYICDYGLENLTEDKISQMITYANAAASLVTLKKGAIKSMPSREEIDALL